MTSHYRTRPRLAGNTGQADCGSVKPTVLPPEASLTLLENIEVPDFESGNGQPRKSRLKNQRSSRPSRSNTPVQQPWPRGAQNHSHGRQSMGRNHASPSMRAQHYNDDWKRWPSVKLRLVLPNGYFDFRAVHDLITPHGSITKIDWDRTNGYAYVSLFPPPQLPFWKSGKLPIPGPKNSRPATICIMLMPFQNQEYIPSPLDPNIKLQACTTLYGEQLDFGVMTSPSCMMQMKSVRSRTAARGITFQTKVNRQELEVRFNLTELKQKGDLVEASRFCFIVPFRNIGEVQEVTLDSETTAFVFTLSTPPEFFKRVRRPEVKPNSVGRPWLEWQGGAWARQTDIVLPDQINTYSCSPIRFRNENALIDIGRWLTYQFVFKHGKSTVNCGLEAMKSVLKTFNIKIAPKRQSELTVIPRAECNIWKYLALPEAESTAIHSQPSSHGLDEMQSGMKHLPFSILYQLHVCIASGKLNEHNLSEDFFQKLSEMDESLALQILETAAENKTRQFEPMEIFKAPITKRKKRKIPSYATQKCALSLTPTSFKVWTPVVETSNRMERKWWKIQDRFLRVRFVNEEQGRINDRSDDAEGQILSRVRRALEHGIILGDRHYEFLGFGNSQFREHSAYFFAPIKGLANWPDIFTEDMRACMGDLTHIKNPAKFAARLGQNFSTTRAIGTAVTVNYNIDDIETNDKYIFSDGVGKMSFFIARLIAIELGLSNLPEDPPSVVQFRLGGCKGVLAISPEVQGREVLIRPSQKKFDSPNLGLEVIRPAQFVSPTLNRQLILILATNGVEGEVFKGMVRDVLNDLARAMEHAASALDLLQRNVDINQMTLTLAAMVKDGFMESKEPFVMSMLRLWRAWTIKYIKEKAKVPFTEGACLLGCMDEYGVLKGHFENQQHFLKEKAPEKRIPALPEVFIQIDPQRKGRYRIIEGICLVARNPSLHPGDVRVVHAVNKPELHHLKNCIVFPQTGDRDVPSMCSGGDLDGDDYLVIWQKSLFPKEWNHAPMDFTPKASIALNRGVEIKDVISFFTQYIKNDQLRPIATAHVIWADQSPLGVKDERCLELAKLHSDAVDYPKSGIAVKLAQELRSPKRPHFMPNNYTRDPRKIYHSKGILGQLYEMIKPVQFAPEYGLQFDRRILDAFELDDAVLRKAVDLKRLWDINVKRMMIHLGIESDFEVFSCFVMTHNETKKDYSLAEELGYDIQSLKTQFRELCAEAAGGRSYQVLGSLIVAMYTVTAREVENALAERSQAERDEEQLHKNIPSEMPLMSFPWIFQKELGIIAKGLHHDAPDITVKFNQVSTGVAVTKPFENNMAKSIPQQNMADLLSRPVPPAVARELGLTVQTEEAVVATAFNNVFENSDSSTTRTASPSTSSVSGIEELSIFAKSRADSSTSATELSRTRSPLDIKETEGEFEADEDYEVEEDDDEVEVGSLVLATERLRKLNQT